MNQPSRTASNDLIDKTQKFWQPRTHHQLTNEDARQIAENITGFFAILAEWSRPATPTPDDSSHINREVCYDR